MTRSSTTKLSLLGILALVLAMGAWQLATPPPAVAWGTCVCPQQLFPGCTFTYSYTWTDNGVPMKCCIYDCGAEYCGTDGPGNC